MSSASTVRRKLKHGLCYSPEYYAWRAIKGRCGNPKNPGWKNYGARGIRICQEWADSFEAFYAYVGPRPSAGHSIDRYPNNDGNYEPGNVRWATSIEQNRNRRGLHWITFDGRTMVMAEWAKELGLAKHSLIRRLRRYPLEIALTFKNLRKLSHFGSLRYRQRDSRGRIV